MYLNVSAVRRRTRVNGPGLRSAVWVQGCTLRCAGCFNPKTHAHEARTLWEPERLADALAEPDIEGISILGGEPFEQASACARLAERARETHGLSVVTYSGYTWGYLRGCRLPEVKRLLAATDLLIAGPFMESRGTDGTGWHGSTNQELVYLTDRYNDSIRGDWRQLHVVEAATDGRILDVTGIPSAYD